MTGLLRAYGRPIVALFIGAVAFWTFVLILAPQLAVLERALTRPADTLSSSIVRHLEKDAANCSAFLQRILIEQTEPLQDDAVGLGVKTDRSMNPKQTPSTDGLAARSINEMVAPGDNGQQDQRPYNAQCDRTTTHKLLRNDVAQPLFLHEAHDLPVIAVVATDPILHQIAAAERVKRIAEQTYQDLLSAQTAASRVTAQNFVQLTQAVLTPVSADNRVTEDVRLTEQMYSIFGLRFEQDGEIYEQIGLITLARTLSFAVLATVLSLVVCYPIAYKVALATPPKRAAWLFLGLLVPCAIIEPMRIYAWSSIIDKGGVLNEFLLWTGAITEPIALERSAITVLVVIIYTYVLFMVFPIFNALSNLDKNQIEAATDLGARPWRVHWRVIIPHAKPGIAVGCIATFMLGAGAFSVPRIISRDPQAAWFSETLYSIFLETGNSNVGAAYSFAYTLVSVLLVALFIRITRARLRDFARTP
ncbi:MAG: ABC transporter permease [Pseudomonadota bacterium]